MTGALGMTLPAVLAPAWAFYLGSLVSSFSPAATITVRAMSSRCVTEDEVGKLFAVISLMSAVSSSLISAAYQSIYLATIDTFAGAFLIVNAAFFLVTIPNNLYLRRKLE